MSKKKVVKKEKNIDKENYYDLKSYRIFMDVIAIIGMIVGVFSLHVAYLVRGDTEELAKLSDKSIYYDIRLYLNEDSLNSAVESDKFISISLTLIVDDFKINNKTSLDVNYNEVFTKTKYYMVYDYSIPDKKYNYMRYMLDDKTEAQMRFDEKLYVAPVKLNYSFTPNKEYCYILIYTETATRKNLDLIFFRYYDKGKSFSLDTIIDSKDVEMIDINRIDSDVVVCEEYFTDLWADGVASKVSDLEFMFDVYEDLKEKLI